MSEVDHNPPVVASYQTLRTLIGIMGIALPLSVWIGTWLLDGEPLLSSISTYYYGSMRDVFVGILVATGAFLATYRGYAGPDDNLWGPISDNLLTNLAGLAAVGIALFPTEACELPRCAELFPGAPWTRAPVVHSIHLVSAGTFFLSTGTMSLFQFTKGYRRRASNTRMDRIRYLTYVACGWVILLSVGAMLLYGLLLPEETKASLAAYRPVFVAEAAAIWAFGIAWLTKGEAITTSKAWARTAVRA